MTIDEAIKHHLDEAERNERDAKYKSMYANRSSRECLRCAAEHRQLAEWLTELKEARKLLTPAKYKIEHEEYDMHGEHYRDDYAVCPNCGKVFGNIKWLYIAKGICYSRVHKGVSFGSFCPDCGQKIDWDINE